MNPKLNKNHYEFVLSYIDELLSILSSDNYNEENKDNFYIREYSRVFKADEDTSSIALHQQNYFLLICAISMMGINKEDIEKKPNLKEYGYNIKYPIENLDDQISKISKIIPNTITNRILIKSLKKKNDFFSKERTIDTPYNEWLYIDNINIPDNYNPNYIFLTRNAFMHSEYNFMETRFSGIDFIEIKNNNFTRFKGRILLQNFLEFIKSYYSNDSYTGIKNNIYIIEETDLIDIDQILDDLKLYKLNYNNKELDFDKRLETYQNFENESIINQREFINKFDINQEQVFLTEKQKESIKKIINHYFKNNFESFNDDKRNRLLLQTIKFVIDPKSILSEWIMHFYLNTSNIFKKCGPDNTFISVYGSTPSLLLLKSYTILYRIQNSAFEEIDYGLFSDFTYIYTENNLYNYDIYENFKIKMINKGIIVTEEEYKKRYFLEIFRDSLAHGNIDIEIGSEEEYTEYIIFKDVYKGKERKITIEINELNKFLNSDCFKQTKLKEEDNVEIRTR